MAKDFWTAIPKDNFQARAQRFYAAWEIFSENTVARRSLWFLCAVLGIALFAPFVAPHDPIKVDLALRLQPASSTFWLGTDELGRDILSRLIYGTRTTIYVAVFVTLLTVPIGVFIGILAGYCGGWLDRFLMRLTDIFLALPRLILALAFVAALGPGMENLVIAMALTSWTSYARVARAETVLIRQENFVKGAELQGAKTLYLLRHYILPLCIPSIVVRVTYDMAGVILMAAGFGFLGLGVQPPTPEWGAMVASGQGYILTHWWATTVPGLAIFTMSLALNFIGDGLRDVVDPRKGN